MGIASFFFGSVCHLWCLIVQFTNQNKLIQAAVCCFCLFVLSRPSQYSAFRAEKRENGYSEEELEESFGFLLLDDKSRVHARNTEHHHGPVFKPN